ncbi:MAG: S41 family peptidase [Hyphomonadaceae bacterium]
MAYRKLVVALAVLAAGCAGTPEQAPEPQQQQAEKPAACATEGAMVDLLAMQAVVKAGMAYPLGGGVSIDEVVETLKPMAAAAKDKAEHLRVLEAFVYALGDHHAHLSTNDKHSPKLVPTGASVWVEWRDGRLVVTEKPRGPRITTIVTLDGKQMPAPNEPILTERMIIEKIDGVPVAQALKPPPSTAERADAMMGFAGRVLLAGTREHAPVVTVRSADGNEVDIPVSPRMAATGSNASLNFPLKDVAVIRLNNSIGNTDLTPVFDDLMKQAKSMHTIILDLRNTPSGGDSVVAKPLMAWFVEGTKGYQKHVRGSESWVEQVEGRKDRFKGKLIVLVDHWTGSMGEGAAIGLRAAAGAIIVGTPMAGLRGAIESFDVPCFGVSLRIPVERLYEVNGTPRELAMPDVLVTEEDLATGQGDVILQRALLLAH